MLASPEDANFLVDDKLEKSNIAELWDFVSFFVVIQITSSFLKWKACSFLFSHMYNIDILSK